MKHKYEHGRGLTERFTMQITPDELAELQAYARASGRSASHAARQCIKIVIGTDQSWRNKIIEK